MDGTGTHRGRATRKSATASWGGRLRTALGPVATRRELSTCLPLSSKGRVRSHRFELRVLGWLRQTVKLNYLFISSRPSCTSLAHKQTCWGSAVGSDQLDTMPRAELGLDTHHAGRLAF